jgi:hypothetical protein
MAHMSPNSARNLPLLTCNIGGMQFASPGRALGKTVADMQLIV